MSRKSDNIQEEKRNKMEDFASANGERAHEKLTAQERDSIHTLGKRMGERNLSDASQGGETILSPKVVDQDDKDVTIDTEIQERKKGQAVI